MTLNELKELKSYIVDKYIKSGKQDKDLMKLKRLIDEIIKRRLEHANNIR